MAKQAIDDGVRELAEVMRRSPVEALATAKRLYRELVEQEERDAAQRVIDANCPRCSEENARREKRERDFEKHGQKLPCPECNTPDKIGVMRDLKACAQHAKAGAP